MEDTLRRFVLFCTALALCSVAAAREPKKEPALPHEFEMGRHTFFDFGPPFDFYEVILVRPAPSGSVIQRILLTPAGNACVQPAKVETTSVTLQESVAELLGTANPCTIPEKELRRELKRCKKCMVFSGQNVTMQAKCGEQTRIIRSDILDRDLFDPAANTPTHTSWTMRLLSRLDRALGPGVMDKPAFFVADEDKSPVPNSNSDTFREIAAGKYDQLFPGTSDKPSALYREAQNQPPPPSVTLTSVSVQPEVYPLPTYPLLAKLARIEGPVQVDMHVGSDGRVESVSVKSGHPMLIEPVKQAIKGWRFPQSAGEQDVQATVLFASNCTAEK
jgi:TonB family protein